ncbi:MAG: hypothetical protein ACPL4N_03055 [Candidatus Norongarragalinales archaeon]
MSKPIFENENILVVLEADGTVNVKDTRSGRIIGTTGSAHRAAQMRAAQAERRSPQTKELLHDLLVEAGYDEETAPADIYLLAKLAIGGDLKALKMFREVTGLHNRENRKEPKLKDEKLFGSITPEQLRTLLEHFEATEKNNRSNDEQVGEGND